MVVVVVVVVVVILILMMIIIRRRGVRRYRRYDRYDVALARFRAAFPNAPEDEFIALVHDTAECYGMSEEEVVGEISGRRRGGAQSTDALERLAKGMFRAAIGGLAAVNVQNNLKKNAKFVFQVRREDETLETTAAMLDKRSVIDSTIGDYASRPEGIHDPRVTPDPYANFFFKDTALSRVAYEYAPGRLDEFHSAVHRAASHHGVVAMERIVLVLTTPGMFWCTPEDEHAMDTRGSKHVMIREDSGEYVVAIVSPLYSA